MKIKVLMASVLNPINHSRIYEKESKTLDSAGFEVHILGKAANINHSSIQFHPLPQFSRLSLKRLFVFYYFIQLAIKLKPHFIHIHTPELLLPSLFLKLFLKTQIIYDVHEDYYLNLKSAKHYPKIVRIILANCVRAVELFSKVGVSKWIYAEKCFYNILNVPIKNLQVIENRFKPIDLNFNANFPFKCDKTLFYGGTISNDWGVLEALETWKLVNQHEKLNLCLVGISNSKNFKEEIYNKVNDWGLNDQFYWYKEGEYVNYEELLAFLKITDFCIAFYNITDAIKNRIPTKFWEYAYYQKPFIFSDDNFWNELNNKYNWGKAAKNPEIASNILKTWIQDPLKIKQLDENELWRSQEINLLKIYK